MAYSDPKKATLSCLRKKFSSPDLEKIVNELWEEGEWIRSEVQKLTFSDQDKTIIKNFALPVVSGKQIKNLSPEGKEMIDDLIKRLTDYNLTELPYDPFTEIGKYLGMSDLLNLGMVNRALNSNVWKFYSPEKYLMVNEFTPPEIMRRLKNVEVNKYVSQIKNYPNIKGIRIKDAKLKDSELMEM